MKRYFLSHIPMAIGYALIVFATRSGWWRFEWASLIPWTWWVLGVSVGVLVLFADRIAYTFSYPGTQISQQFAWYIKEKKYMTALNLLDARRLEQERLTFRSSLFMAIWVPLALFAITSTPGLFGKGVVMGLMLHILADDWKLQMQDPKRLHIRLFWLIKREITDEQRATFLWVITVFFVMFSFGIR